MRITLQSRFAANNSLLMRSNAASGNMARFPELSENDLASLLESKNSENTKKATKNKMIKQLLDEVEQNIGICQWRATGYLPMPSAVSQRSRLYKMCYYSFNPESFENWYVIIEFIIKFSR
jgi:hypothetical protein